MNPENIAVLIRRVDALEKEVARLTRQSRTTQPMGPSPAQDAEFEEERKKKIEEIVKSLEPLPVDRSQQTLTDGSPVTPDHRELKENGQQKAYVVLSQAERNKGYIRPVRRSYVHTKCGCLTTMSAELAETYARDPKFYGGTFCCECGMHFPVDQFTWAGTTELVGS